MLPLQCFNIELLLSIHLTRSDRANDAINLQSARGVGARQQNARENSMLLAMRHLLPNKAPVLFPVLFGTRWRKRS